VVLLVLLDQRELPVPVVLLVLLDPLV
jgi:hypothetical protein